MNVNLRKVNLDEYVGKKVEITITNLGSDFTVKTHIIGVLKDSSSSAKIYKEYFLEYHDSSNKSRYITIWSDFSWVGPSCEGVITDIKVLDSSQDKIKELENKIKDIQNEIIYLKKKEGLPMKFNRDAAIRYLKTKEPNRLINAFCWDSTPQGLEHWRNIYDKITNLQREDIIQIQEWIISSFQKELNESI